MAPLSRSLVFTILVLATCMSSANAMFCGEHNCFELLGLKRTATKAEIRRAYRQISVEKHPDKRPGDKKAAEEFRFISAAYETLTSSEKRAKYEDFLDHPEKYWEYYMMHAKEYYAPKSNVLVVIMGIIGVATGLHWMNMNYNYEATQAKMRESMEFKKQVAQLVKSKMAKDKEEAQEMIDLDIVGLEKPEYKDLLVCKLGLLPLHAANYLLWALKWLVMYKIFRTDYSDEDKMYLIRKNMGLDERAWERLSQDEKNEYMEKELWDKLKLSEYEREKRFALRKAGKLKKKKRHVPQPYVDEEVMPDFQ